jgi:hypothetical protein
MFHAPKPVMCLANAEWQKPGFTVLTIIDLLRSLSLSSRAKKTLSTIEKAKISLHPYVNKDILTFAIHISASWIGLDTAFSFTNIPERNLKLLTPNIRSSQISPDRPEN